jgi:hypothetical protein
MMGSKIIPQERGSKNAFFMHGDCVDFISLWKKYLMIAGTGESCHQRFSKSLVAITLSA